MSYVVRGLDHSPYKPLFDLSDEDLAKQGVLRMTVTDATFPCRVSLTNRAVGETVLLLNHVSHEVSNPYRASHAIFVAEADQAAAEFIDCVPPAFEKRILSLRGFDRNGMMAEAALAEPGGADAAIRKLFDNPEVETIHVHNAVRGCFSAKIERHS